nr:type II toxin-antitoxin system prevent-host-death family antitoxin [Mycolicibacterium celeriflavum]
MSTVASRELRNDTAGVLRRVQAGEEITITVNGRAVAVIAAVEPRRRHRVSKAEFLKRLETSRRIPAYVTTSRRSPANRPTNSASCDDRSARARHPRHIRLHRQRPWAPTGDAAASGRARHDRGDPR